MNCGKSRPFRCTDSKLAMNGLALPCDVDVLRAGDRQDCAHYLACLDDVAHRPGARSVCGAGCPRGRAYAAAARDQGAALGSALGWHVVHGEA